MTVPATIMRSLWRGEARKTPAPKRSRSYFVAAVAIISMAQHASPKAMGQSALRRPQSFTHSSLVRITDCWSSGSRAGAAGLSAAGLLAAMRAPDGGGGAGRRGRAGGRGGEGSLLGGLGLGVELALRGAGPLDVAAGPDVGEAGQQDHQEGPDLDEGEPAEA